MKTLGQWLPLAVVAAVVVVAVVLSAAVKAVSDAYARSQESANKAKDTNFIEGVGNIFNSVVSGAGAMLL